MQQKARTRILLSVQWDIGPHYSRSPALSPRSPRSKSSCPANTPSTRSAVRSVRLVSRAVRPNRSLCSRIRASTSVFQSSRHSWTCGCSSKESTGARCWGTRTACRRLRSEGSLRRQPGLRSWRWVWRSEFTTLWNCAVANGSGRRDTASSGWPYTSTSPAAVVTPGCPPQRAAHRHERVRGSTPAPSPTAGPAPTHSLPVHFGHVGSQEGALAAHDGVDAIPEGLGVEALARVVPQRGQNRGAVSRRPWSRGRKSGRGSRPRTAGNRESRAPLGRRARPRAGGVEGTEALGGTPQGDGQPKCRGVPSKGMGAILDSGSLRMRFMLPR